MGVSAFLGFAKAVLALDLDVVEALFEGEADDLGALRRGGAIGDECQAHTQRLEAIEGLVSAGKHAQFGFVELVEAIGDRIASLAWRNRPAGAAREPRERPRYDVAPCRADTGAPILVSCCIG